MISSVSFRDMFKYGVGHDGKRPAVRGGKKGNIVGNNNNNDKTKKARKKKKGRVGGGVKFQHFSILMASIMSENNRVIMVKLQRRELEIEY